MRKFFIYLFHGHTDDDLNSYMSQMSQHSLRYERTIDDLRTTIKELKEDNKYLGDLIFKDKGVIQNNLPENVHKNLDPIALTSPSWRLRRERLEAQDRARVEANKQANATEQHWMNKMERDLNNIVDGIESQEEIENGTES